MENQNKFKAAIEKIINSKKRGDNLFYFSSEEYNKKIQKIKEIKLGTQKKTDNRFMRKYDVVTISGIDKLIKPIVENDSDVLYYVTVDELFEVIHTAHLAVRHGGRNRMMAVLKTKYCNVTTEAVMIYLDLCSNCKQKQSNPKSGLCNAAEMCSSTCHVEDCKKKLKRDSHNRCKRKLSTGSTGSAKKYLPSADCVSFLNTVENERSSTCNIKSESVEKNVKEDTVIEGDLGVLPLQVILDSPGCSLVDKHARSQADKLSVLLTKRAEERNRTIKRFKGQNQLIFNSEEHKDDDIDLFFKSLALTVKKLPKVAIKEAKLKALIMVNELEDKYSDISTKPSRTFCPIQTYNNYEYSSNSTPSSIAYSMPDNKSTTSPDLFQPQTTASTSFFMQND